jgi:hypothetical protein
LADFKKYQRKPQTVEMRPYVAGEDITKVAVFPGDKAAGSPKAGDMIARNTRGPDQQWLVPADEFQHEFEAV